LPIIEFNLQLDSEKAIYADIDSVWIWLEENRKKTKLSSFHKIKGIDCLVRKRMEMLLLLLFLFSSSLLSLSVFAAQLDGRNPPFL